MSGGFGPSLLTGSSSAAGAFSVPGVPVSKARAGRTKEGRSYTPKETAGFENRVRWAATEAGISVLEGNVEIEITAYWPMIGKAKLIPRPRTPKGTRPDLDNLVKSVADALNGIGYRDDGQVCSIRATKWYAAQGEPARTIITVRPFQEQ